MGYTVYWTQKRDHTKKEWAEIVKDVGVILDHVANKYGVTLVEESDEPTKPPHIDGDEIRFNGVGEEGHETFLIPRVRFPLESWEEPRHRGSAFCKTERKPYDLAVKAALCYLGTVSCTFSVETDGHGADWLAGLEAAREALPRYANVLDIPREILEDDRWCSPWVQNKSKGYQVRFCVDGHGYVLMGKASYRFDTHADLARWLEAHKEAKFRRAIGVKFGSFEHAYLNEPNIWGATGAFDKARNERLGKAQAKALASLFPAPPEHAHQPPALARPNQFPELDRPYWYTDLLNAA